MAGTRKPQDQWPHGNAHGPGALRHAGALRQSDRAALDRGGSGLAQPEIVLAFGGEVPEYSEPTAHSSVATPGQPLGASTMSRTRIGCTNPVGRRSCGADDHARRLGKRLAPPKQSREYSAASLGSPNYERPLSHLGARSRARLTPSFSASFLAGRGRRGRGSATAFCSDQPRGA
jgi:hypothetical protein